MSIRIFALVALIAVAAAGVLRVQYLQSENKRISEDLKFTKAEKTAVDELLKTERQAVLEADLLRTEHLATIEVIENENRTYRDCIADRTCGVRIERASCPSVPKTTADSSGTQSGSPELDADIQQNILDLREGIMKLEADYKWIHASYKNCVEIRWGSAE